MTSEVKEAVLAVLRQSQYGICQKTSHRSIYTSLKHWQKAINRLMIWLGGDPPFMDSLNYINITCMPLYCLVDVKLINEAMKELAGDSECQICGSKNLEADPAGYYCHAYAFDGAPLLCREHNEH